jgi:general secretion pathway protein F
MPVFEYQGMNRAGKRVRNVLDADNPRVLRERLKKQGIFLTDYVEGAKARIQKGSGLRREVYFKKMLGQKITSMEVAMLTRQLATLQKAGIPLLESLNAIVEQIDKESLKRIMSDVRERVNEGTSFADSLKAHPKVFSDLYVNMVRAGEMSGNLDIVLERLTDFLESHANLRGKIMAALYYPILMTVMGTGILIFLFVYVIPKVTMIFEEQGQALPFLTRALIGVASFMSNPWNMLLLMVLLAGAIVGFRKWKATETGRYKWDVLKLRAPIVGKTVRMIAVARFTRTLSTLLASGVPLLTAMDIVKQILGNARLIEVIEEVRANVREGDSIAGPMKRSGEFDPIVTHMIAIGEKSGRLEPMLENISEAYETQLDNRLRALTSLLEPLMILAMGLVVALIVFAILVPILQIGKGYA